METVSFYLSLLSVHSNPFLFALAMLVFRAFKTASKMKVKLTHSLIHASSIIFITLGIAVELISHYHHGEKDFYTLHSWVGVLTIIVFVSQFIFGFLCFLSPFIKEKVKKFYLPIHVFFGTFCFILAVATSLIGLNQTARFNPDYSEFTNEGVLINTIGLCMVAFGLFVVFLSTNTSYRRDAEVKADDRTS